MHDHAQEEKEAKAMREAHQDENLLPSPPY
jgi:hypothetical protein